MQRDVRNRSCEGCDFHKGAESVCITGQGRSPTGAMIVSDPPSAMDDRNGKLAGDDGLQYLNSVAADIGFDLDDVYITPFFKCSPGERRNDKKTVAAAQKACAQYLDEEIKRTNPRAILAMGASAYYYFAHKQGITKNRGQEFFHEESGCMVIPTISPRAVLIRPELMTDFEADVRKWWRYASGQSSKIDIDVVEVKDRLQFGIMMAQLEKDDTPATFDLETRGFHSMKTGYSKVWCAAITKGRKNDRGEYIVYLVGLEHPDSGWDTNKDSNEAHDVIRQVCEYLITKGRMVGHNVKFDRRWIEGLAKRWGIKLGELKPIHFDTIIAAHLTNETRYLNLLNQASVELGVSDWGKGQQHFGSREGDPADILARNCKELTGKKPDKTWLGDLWGEDALGTYCAYDTVYTHLLYESLKHKLTEDQGIARLAKKLMFPGVDALTAVELNGIYVRQDLMKANEKIVAGDRDDSYKMLLEFLPPEHREAADFGNDNYVRKWLYADEPDGLGLTPLSYTPSGQPKADAPTLVQINHEAVKSLLTFRKSETQLAFFAQWTEWMGDNSRVYPYYNLTGTVTGRRSCGNPNLQQVPRVPVMRSCFGAPEGKLFMEADFSQLEVRIAAWLSGDEALLEIFNEGRDAYTASAAQMFNIPDAEVDKEMRQRHKARVLGYIYDMSSNGFVTYAFDTFGLIFTEDEAKTDREEFFAMFPGILGWHERQKHLVRKHAQVVSPTGRTRHLFNIMSSNMGERMKAERQAINSPDQGTGADWTLAAAVELQDMLDPAKAMVVGDIHDALLFELDQEHWRESAATILQVMEAPKIMKTLGVDAPIRMVAEGKIGMGWGEGEEFTLGGVGGKADLATLALPAEILSGQGQKA